MWKLWFIFVVASVRINKNKELELSYSYIRFHGEVQFCYKFEANFAYEHDFQAADQGMGIQYHLLAVCIMLSSQGLLGAINKGG
jgi:hypothetical protein